MEFLPLVENTNIIIDIGNWVIHQTLQQMSNWIANGYTWVVSVNIAARHFQHADFLENLRSYLAQFPDVPPEYLEIEILESAALQDVQQVREVMSACQQLVCVLPSMISARLFLFIVSETVASQYSENRSELRARYAGRFR
jgi:EAL domain-containing protein (putative c-di-GMP-specific phosphodiesterase class I)